jgi:hypothetical protein
MGNVSLAIAVFVSALMFGYFTTAKRRFGSDNVAELWRTLTRVWSYWFPRQYFFYDSFLLAIRITQIL